ncbi:TPM domain-containing protein [Brevundimonas sp. NIBR11]|uniref:TPM domain-containing protein n=1 Tax=Brevundimonas sp. NIBR11 TaxID=3015999 RepID=UPI0022F05C9C|nr:TPM domain-containing protein [Brevundimonas sp. NIBR11]
MRLNSSEHARVASAIAAAEARTSGEIFCVLAKQVSSYRDISLAWSAAAALIVPLALIPLGFDSTWFPGLSDHWEAAHLAALDISVGRAVGIYAVVQAAVFLGAYVLLRIPALTRLVTPRGVRRDRARQAAMHQFLAHGLHVTEHRTGVLIFAAMADRQVEIIADQGIHSRVDPTVWAEAVEVLTEGLRTDRAAEGFEKAIALVGGVLAGHFPPRSRNPNEVPDRLVEI